MIGIIDYGMGNLGSVTNAFRFLELPARIVRRPEEMEACRLVVLPGVGAFGDCMAHLEREGFVPALRDWIARDRPFFGICLGLQALFEGSEETPDVPGLGVLKGQVRRFPADPELKVPQIGWNRVEAAGPGEPLFRGIPDRSYFYFVHSFYAAPDDASCVAGWTAYGMRYASAVRQGRAMAVQFHPEKSQQLGLTMLRNVYEWSAHVPNV